MPNSETGSTQREAGSSSASGDQGCTEALAAVAADFGDFILEEIDFFDKELEEIRELHEKNPYEALARKDRLMRSMLQRIRNENRKLQKKPLPFFGADNISEIRTILAKIFILLMIMVEKLEEVQKLLPKEKGGKAA